MTWLINESDWYLKTLKIINNSQFCMVPNYIYIYIYANATDANVSLVQNSIVFPHLLGGY